MSEKCEKCGEIMERGTDLVYIVYSCPSCGHGFETDEYASIFNEVEFDDVPEGCRACGGAYPSCRGSCNLIDE
jgi:Acetyl-CoA carboxylase beta subunit